MKLKFAIFLTFVAHVWATPIFDAGKGGQLQTFDDSEVIACTFEPPQGPYVYTCNLHLQNPTGRNDFTEVAGDHIDGFGNSDVESVFTLYQSSRNIPSIICAQFPNTLDIIFEMSAIEVVDADTFVACERLEFLMIGANNIAALPAGLFRGNGNLAVILLSNNNIAEIAADAFAGTSAAYIDLGGNELTAFSPAWTAPVNETLEILLLNRNRFSSLPFFPFSSLGQLRELDLSANPLALLYDYTFFGLRSLRRLYLSDLGLTAVNPNWFLELASLQHLFLGHNRIRELRALDFDALASLVEINLSDNALTFVSADAFGRSLATLADVHLTLNRVVAIEEAFFEAAANLRWLLLAGNDCFGANIYDAGGNREETAAQLAQCFANFVGAARCEMFDLRPYPYECVLHIMNPVGRDFDAIEVTHGEGRGDADVEVVEAVAQNTRNFPSVVCRQFVNVDFIYMQGNEIEFVGADSFADCANLWKLTLANNRIAVLPDGTFASNPSLQIFEVFLNEIREIGEGAFAGSGLRTISLEGNALSEFSAAAFEPIADTLQELLLGDNLITSIPDGGFSRLPGLTWIDLSDNRIEAIPANAFRFLTRLEHLELRNTGLRSIEPEWFTELFSLFDLRLDGNNINALPHGVFDNLQSLTTISLSRNQIRNLHGSSFGRSLNTLVYLLATDNSLRAIDPSIVDDSPNLAWLHLSNNFCANLNFYNVRSDVEAVREQLAECFRLFEGFLECTYFDYFAYLCRLTAQNVQGRDDWTEVGGAHVDGKGDSDVRIVEAYMQDTANVPSILCRQFSALTEIHITRSFLERIDADAFEDCANIEALAFNNNNIREIADFTFAGSPRLHAFEAIANRIGSIGARAFDGLQLIFLELDTNELTEFEPQWVAASHESLMFLYLSQNRISELPANAFAGLGNLLVLDVSANPMRGIPATAFDGLRSVQEVWLDRMQLQDVDPRWFRDLHDLQFVSFFRNEISSLRPGTFDNLPSLYEIELGHNRLTMLHADMFGSLIPNLIYFFADHNQINLFDPEIFDGANDLVYLFLSGNECINSDFYGVFLNRDEVRSSLDNCFANFEAPGLALCYFLEYPTPDDYSCVLNIVNPSGREYDSIAGNHLDGRSNADVTAVEAGSQNSRIVPSIFCDEFTSLRSIDIHSSRVERLTAVSFRNCRNLRTIKLNNNHITSIGADVLGSVASLEHFEVQLNLIHSLAPAAFEGTALKSLWLGGNRLETLAAEQWRGIEATLESLFLFENRLVEIDENLFAQLTSLLDLDVGLNQGIRVPAGAFRSLTRLQRLFLDNSAIERVEPEWFSALSDLTALHLLRNRIRSLPPAVFAPLTSLVELTIGGNPIESLHASSFGAQTNLHVLAAGSDLNAVDERLLDAFASLNMYDTQCANANFADIGANIEEVREQMAECTANFRGNIECHYMQFGGRYACLLFVQNIAGHDAFESIAGNHSEGNADADVRLVESLVQNTRNVPSVICTQFANVEEIFIEESRIERITVGECARLRRLTLAYNNIETIEAGTFGANAALEHLDLRMNRITAIADDAFAGAALNNLDLSSNHLGTFNPAWVASILPTLRSLELYENAILSLDEDAFAPLSDLHFLDLGLNPNIRLPSNVFAPLTSLRELFIDSSNLRRIDTQWFAQLALLTDLHLHSNSLRVLPDGAFAPLADLAYFSVRNNRLTSLRSAAFGDRIGNLTRLYAQNNQIAHIDEAFFDRVSETLQLLYLYENVCVSMNFYDVSENVAMVREELQPCFG